MDKSTNIVCEAAGCRAPATRELEVKAGEGRSILLYLCSQCVPKFEEKSQHSESMVAHRDQSMRITPPPSNWNDVND